MTIETDTNLASTIAVVLISVISGFVSIANRIAKGMAWTSLLILGEFAAAILCGGLMWDAYPTLANDLPPWCTRWVATALAAHFGGRALQFIENSVLERISKVVNK